MNALITVVLVTCQLAAQAGCNRGDSPYKDLPATANPTLRKLRDLAAPILSEHAASTTDGSRAVAACLAAEPELVALRNVDFHDRRTARRAGTAEVNAIVLSLLEHRPTMCLPDTGDGTRTATCQAWCIERWHAFAAAIELVRQKASGDGIEIVSLRAPG